MTKRSRLGAVTAMALSMAACTGLGGNSQLDPGATDLTTTTRSVVFGADGRTDYKDITDSRFRTYGDATAALVTDAFVSCSGAICNLINLPQYTQGAVKNPANPNGPALTRPLCSTVRYRGQKQAAGCSAFLVAPDLVMTAGHCLCPMNMPCTASPCSTTSVVFDFNADSAGNTPTTIASDAVYHCTGTPLGAYNASEDWAVFTVNRVVTQRTPLIPHYAGPLAHNELRVYGYGEGLPLKMSTGASVTLDDPTDVVHYQSDADIFVGNSGGPSVDSVLGLAVGITTNAPWHYVDVSDGLGGFCAAVNVCGIDGTGPGCGFILHTRVSYAAKQGNVPLHSALVASLE